MKNNYIKKRILLLSAVILALSPLTVTAIAAPNMSVSPVELNGALDFDLDDINEDDWEEKLVLRDVMARMDVQAASWLAARLQVACEGNIGVDDGTTCDFKNATIGLRQTFAGQELVVSIGKQTMPFGGSTTRRAIDRNDAVHALNEQTERKIGVVIALAPNIKNDHKVAQVMNQLFSLVEVGVYNGSSDGSTKLSQLDTLDSYSARVSGAISNVFTQLSYLDQKDGEKRMGVAASTALLNTGFDIYGEWMNVKDSVLNPGLESAATVGIARNIKGYNASLEYTKQNSKSDDINDRVAVSATKEINRHFSVGAEVSSDKDGKDVKGMITANAKLNTSSGRQMDNRSLFPSIQKRVDEQRQRVSELSKANKK